MPDTRKENRIYLTSLILLAVFAVCFVSAMGFLNYRTTAIDLEEQVIARVEMDAVSGVETAIPGLRRVPAQPSRTDRDGRPGA